MRCLWILLLSFLFLFPPSASRAKESSKYIVKKICASDLAKGPLARVILYKNHRRELGFYEFIPDSTLAPHGPHIFHDAKGKQVLVLPDLPQDPLSPAAQEIGKKRENLIQDYQPADAVFCVEVKKVKK